MNCVVPLEDCMSLVEGGTGSRGETSVTCHIDGTEEDSIEVEDTVDVQNTIPQAVTSPSTATEHQVRLCVVCVLVAAHTFRPLISPERKL